MLAKSFHAIVEARAKKKLRKKRGGGQTNIATHAVGFLRQFVLSRAVLANCKMPRDIRKETKNRKHGVVPLLRN